MYDDIVINVPKHWDDEKKDHLAKLMKALHLPDTYRIMITNKMDVNIVDTDTMDRLRGNTSNG
jgi:hypothetical protein|tara:strand:+ start:732 stop:920 length:189 start_codon:yes stop_codon:yes gene_type:complete